MKKVKPNKNRKVVEIYFILYLAALIFLLPDHKADKSDKDSEIANGEVAYNYQLRPAKTTLNSIIVIDSSGPKILNIDSVNTIFFIGKNKSINYEFQIQDQFTGNRISLTEFQSEESDFFRVTEEPNSSNVHFRWIPPLKDLRSRTYLVSVVATVVPENDTNPIELQTQFTLNVNILSPLGTDLATLQFESQNENDIGLDDFSGQMTSRVPISGGRITLIPQESFVKSIAYKQWKNTVFVSGMNLDNELQQNPNITVTQEPEGNRGTAKIEGISDSHISLSGITPGWGNIKVTLKIVRAGNLDEAVTHFTVNAQSIPEPEYSAIMYPEITYRIKPNLPLISGRNASALLKFGDNKLTESSDGMDFYFTPSISDTGKIIYLERYVDNQILDGRSPHREYIIRIAPFPKPEISRIQNEGRDKARMFTISYGKAGNKENFIIDFEITGNAKIEREVFGLTRTNPENMGHTQVFDITPKDKSKPFKFQITGINSNGQKTGSISYP